MKQKVQLLLSPALALSLALAPISLHSSEGIRTETQQQQGKGKIYRGQIVDETGETLIGVNVRIKGTSQGVVTDLDGNFSIGTSMPNPTLLLSYIGYAPMEVTATDGVMKIVMKSDTQTIDEVVVTALGIKREKKMLGYAFQDVKSSELNKTGNPSVTGALQGKVAGLQMNISGTGLSGSTKITLRGNSSLTDNNQPLWIVDGVPFNDNSSSGASLFGGVDRGGVTADINPEDIESISVLKGPNAAALYGSRAGNGVILITTKKGNKGEGFGVTYNGNFTWSQVGASLEQQRTYGQGSNGQFNPSVSESFGPKLDGHEYEAWNGQKRPYGLNGNKLRDYFQTGFAQTHNISIGGVTDKSDYRISFGDTRSTGLFAREEINKNNLDLKAGMTMNKYLSLDTKISLSRSQAINRPTFGIGGEIYPLIYMPHNINLDDLKTYKNDTHRHINYVGPFPQDLNPYYINNQRDNEDQRWRGFGYASAKINFTDWLFLQAKYAFDYYHTDIEEKDRTDGIVEQTNEQYLSREENFFEQNAEAILFGNNNIGDRIRINYTAGVSEMSQKTHYLMGVSKNMLNNNYWSHNSAQGFNAAGNGLSRRKTRSAFGSFQFAWDEYLSLDLTARNDWSSTLPLNNNSYFYPSANLSFVFSELMKQKNARPSWLSFGKARLSWAQVGKDTEPFRLVNTGSWRQEPSGPVFTPPSEKYNEDLKPEISSSIEAGLDMKFFDNRLGFDFTYYHSTTTNQITRIPQPRSSGYSWKLVNAGEIVNSGFELMLYGTPVRTKDFEWTMTLNLSHNNTIVRKLDPESKYMSFNFRGDNLLVDVGAFEGGRLGDILGTKSYKRNEAGQVITRNGIPLFDTDKPKVIGNIQPDFLASISPTLSYKGLSLSALFDARFGGQVVSVSESIAAAKGMAKRTEQRGEFVFGGIDETTGQPNTTAISAESFYRAVGGLNGVAEEFIYSASFIRFKELSLSYSLPKKWLRSTPLRDIRLSVVGRNLGYLLSHTPGTSPEGGFDISMFSQAIDFTSVPYTRTLGFSLNVQF